MLNKIYMKSYLHERFMILRLLFVPLQLEDNMKYFLCTLNVIFVPPRILGLLEYVSWKLPKKQIYHSFVPCMQLSISWYEHFLPSPCHCIQTALFHPSKSSSHLSCRAWLLFLALKYQISRVERFVELLCRIKWFTTNRFQIPTGKEISGFVRVPNYSSLRGAGLYGYILPSRCEP